MTHVMTNDKTPHILARLELGFRANYASLRVLETDLSASMQSARSVGAKAAPSDLWNTTWQRHWDEAVEIVHRINDLVILMSDLVAGNDGDRLKKALAVWDTAQLEDAKLLATLRCIRTQASELEAPSRKEWNQLARVIESHLETIHASGQALRIKLEMLKRHSNEDVTNLVESIRTKLQTQPRTNRVPAEPFDRDYRKVAFELEQEHHVFLGLLDVIKGLSLWVESPDERMRKNRSLTLDEA